MFQDVSVDMGNSDRVGLCGFAFRYCKPIMNLAMVTVRWLDGTHRIYIYTFHTRCSQCSLSMLWTGNKCKKRRPFTQSILEGSSLQNRFKLQKPRSVHTLAKNCPLLHVHLSGLALQSE